MKKKDNYKTEMISKTGYIEKKYAFLIEGHYPVMEWVIECDVDDLEVKIPGLKTKEGNNNV